MIFEKIKNTLALKLNAKEKEFLPAILEVTETPASPVGRLVLWSLFIVVSSAIIWSFFGHVDEVAIASGKLIPIGNVKVIQAEDKGIIKNILIKDGDKVKAGQVVLELDQTVSAADLASLKTQAAQYQLEIERLTAEQAGLPFLPAPRDGLEDKDIEFQRNNYITRANDYRTRLSVAQQAIHQSMASVQAAQGNIVKYQEMYTIAREQEERIEKLFEKNSISEFVLLNYRSTRLEVQRNIAAQQAELSKAQATTTQNQETLNGITTTYQSDVSTKLLEARKQFLAINEALKKAEQKQALSKVITPIDGRVNQLAVHTVGGIVTAAQALMTIVPEDTTLQMEAWVANKDIGFIYEGQEAEVKIETFNFQKYGTIKGTVVDVSTDSIDGKEKGQIYRVLLNLDKNNVLVNDKFVELGAGMSATADIKIRQKRIIEFFLDPFKKYQNEALRER